MTEDFYAQAVCRNLGLVTPEEQTILKNSRVAIAGLGGVGGSHLLTLVRMGIGHFNIADIDTFSTVNINRQVGANSHTVGRPKTSVMAEMASAIHPDVDIRVFAEGVNETNVRDFLADADLVVDSIDFFAMPARELLYETAQALGKPVLFSAPIGFSGTLHVFAPGGMSFADYFDIHEGMSLFDKLVAFAVGLTPRGTHWRYMDMDKVDLSTHAAPSLASACSISTGLLTTEALVILLKRRPPQLAPRYVQFDPYRGIYRQGRLLWGNRGPLQRLKRWLVARRFRAQAAALAG